jgi:hypothetical protein
MATNNIFERGLKEHQNIEKNNLYSLLYLSLSLSLIFLSGRVLFSALEKVNFLEG